MKPVAGPLFDPDQAEAFWRGYVMPRIASMLRAGKRLRLTVKEDTRTMEQNAHFHALCGDIEAAGFEWGGKPRPAKQWKVLLVSGHAKATEEEFDMVPGLEGEFVNLRESTALMSVRRSASLIEYTLAFMAQNDIPVRESEHVG